MQARVRVSPTASLLNPCARADLYRYEGPMAPFVASVVSAAYKKQLRNYEQLAGTLAPHGIHLSHVWAGKFTDAVGKPRMHWIACDESRSVFWHKAESPGPGTGHNHVYIRGQRIKLTTWLKKTNEERADLLALQ